MSTDRSSATVIGTIDEIGEVKSFGSSNFQKREVVVGIDLDGKYPQLVLVSFAGTNIDKADKLNVGDEVTIECNLRGRRSSTGRVFTDIDAWKVKVTKEATLRPRPNHQPTAGGSNPDDDLPF